jgi:ribosomal protein L37AE/L43A
LFVVPQDVRRYAIGIPHCRHCGVTLTNENWYPSEKRNGHWQCIACFREAAREWRLRTDYNRMYARRIRIEVMEHYGAKCACCGEREVLFLTLDHVNNDGAQDRRSHGSRRDFCGWRFYRWLKTHDYPDEIKLQALCFNCNSAKGYFGACPHEQARSSNLPE